MKFLLDQGLPRSAASLLTARGHETVHAGDVAPGDAPDASLLSLAAASDRVMVTLDADFHALMALSGAAHPSVIRIRIEGLRGPAVSDLVAQVAARCYDDLNAGSLVSVDESSIRLRRLPIG